MSEGLQIFFGALGSVFDMLIVMVYLRVTLRDIKRNIPHVVFLLAFPLVCGLLYICSWITELWAIYLVVSIVGVFCLGFLYKAKTITRIFAAFSFQVIAMMSEVISLNLITMFLHERFNVDDVSCRTYSFLLSKLVLFAIVILISSIIKKPASLLDIKHNLCLLATPVISIAVVVAVVIQFRSENVSAGAAISFAAAGIMIINLFVYYLLQNIIEATVIRERQHQMESQFEYQERKYQQTSDSFRNICSVIHDTNKHLVYLRECAERGETGEAISYIDKAVSMVESSYIRINTGCLAIDALVSNVLNCAEENDITVKTDIHIEKEKITIERYDLSVILGNLLDNAVEACMKIQTPDERKIAVSIISSDNSLVINVINSVADGFSDDFKTIKKDKSLHGFGISNILGLAEKYGGTFVIDYHEKEVEATAVIPQSN